MHLFSTLGCFQWIEKVCIGNKWVKMINGLNLLVSKCILKFLVRPYARTENENRHNNNVSEKKKKEKKKNPAFVKFKWGLTVRFIDLIVTCFNGDYFEKFLRIFFVGIKRQRQGKGRSNLSKRLRFKS